MLNLTQLKVLEAVARHGSVTVAAKELHYSQPSISHHLGRLEAATGAKLIQRVGRGIRLTPEGQLLAGRATEILGRVNAASVELAARVGLRAGRVRPIGITLVRYAVTIHIAVIGVIDHRPRRPMKQAQAAVQPTGRSATTARNSS